MQIRTVIKVEKSEAYKIAKLTAEHFNETHDYYYIRSLVFFNFLLQKLN